MPILCLIGALNEGDAPHTRSRREAADLKQAIVQLPEASRWRPLAALEVMKFVKQLNIVRTWRPYVLLVMQAVSGEGSSFIEEAAETVIPE